MGRSAIFVIYGAPGFREGIPGGVVDVVPILTPTSTKVAAKI